MALQSLPSASSLLSWKPHTHTHTHTHSLTPAGGTACSYRRHEAWNIFKSLKMLVGFWHTLEFLAKARCFKNAYWPWVCVCVCVCLCGWVDVCVCVCANGCSPSFAALICGWYHYLYGCFHYFCLMTLSRCTHSTVDRANIDALTLICRICQEKKEKRICRCPSVSTHRSSLSLFLGKSCSDSVSWFLQILKVDILTLLYTQKASQFVFVTCDRLSDRHPEESVWWFIHWLLVDPLMQSNYQ